MINLNEDIYANIINKIYTSHICLLNCDYRTLKMISLTNKFLNKLISELISEKVVCNIISFNNKKFCEFHNSLEYKICDYLNILKRGLVRMNESSIENNSFNFKYLTNSYHLDDKDLIDDNNKIKLKNLFEQITIGTEFHFKHQCCSGRGIMFDIIDMSDKNPDDTNNSYYNSYNSSDIDNGNNSVIENIM